MEVRNQLIKEIVHLLNVNIVIVGYKNNNHILLNNTSIEHHIKALLLNPALPGNEEVKANANDQGVFSDGFRVGSFGFFLEWLFMIMTTSLLLLRLFMLLESMFLFISS